MGCDIHVSIQRQDADDGVWREIAYQDPPYPWETDAATIPGIPVAPDGFHGRNYDLFGLLADVRNGSGFAGVLTGQGWPSIAPGRGWPDGFDPTTVAPNPKYPEEGPRYMGDHSFTWVALDELLAFPWDSTVTELYGVVPAADYEALSAVGDAPQSYSGGVFGAGIEVYDPPDYARAKATGTLARKPYVRMAWHETARSATGDWPGRVLPWLQTLADGRPLRLVLGFDS